MYGDTQRIRRRAAAIRADASELRAKASALVAQGDELGWRSAASDAFRGRLASAASDLGHRTRLLDEAADALDRHARQVDEVKTAIDEAMNWLTRRRDDAVRVLRAADDAVHDTAAAAAREAEARSRGVLKALASPPPRGSRAWLEVRDTVQRRGW